MSKWVAVIHWGAQVNLPAHYEAHLIGTMRWNEPIPIPITMTGWVLGIGIYKDGKLQYVTSTVEAVTSGDTLEVTFDADDFPTKAGGFATSRMKLTNGQHFDPPSAPPPKPRTAVLGRPMGRELDL